MMIDNSVLNHAEPILYVSAIPYKMGEKLAMELLQSCNKPSKCLLSSPKIMLTHLPLVLHICITESGQHCIR